MPPKAITIPRFPQSQGNAPSAMTKHPPLNENVVTIFA